MTQPLAGSRFFIKRRLRVGVWSDDERITRDYFFDNNTGASVGANLLRPWRNLYVRGKELGVDFVVLDETQSLSELDAIVFVDRPLRGHPFVDAALQSPVKKYLILLGCVVSRPENWDFEYHGHFTRIFTLDSRMVENRRYVKINAVSDFQRPFEFRALKGSFESRKLVALIGDAKLSAHPDEFYSERVRAVRWFEHNAPLDFDVFGNGWSFDEHPSYRGVVGDKLDTLSQYRFSLCFEDAKNIPGYITDKILDCLRAGNVPIYGGASDIERWIPNDCFIDLRRFTSYPELYAAIAGISAEEHGVYLDRIQAFLNSDRIYQFSSECFSGTLIDVLGLDFWDNEGNSDGDSGVVNRDRSGEAIELPPSQVLASVEDRHRQSFCEAGGPKLVVYLGYGYELPVFVRARALWQFFLTHYPNVEAIFARCCPTLPRGEVIRDGYDLVVGTGDKAHRATGEAGYAASGVWSSQENRDVIYRQQAVYDYLLRQRTEPFYLFQTTVTSVVDFRGLSVLLKTLPSSHCFAGSLGRLNSPPNLAGLTFVSGANTLFSSDLLRVMLNRYDPEHPYVNYPNDIWQALILADVERRPLPFFSFTRPRTLSSRRGKVMPLAERLLSLGHYHFRVKTTSAETGLGLREEVDPWVMSEVMDAILSSASVPEANLSLVAHLLASLQPDNGTSLAAYTETNIFRGPRDFPLHDEETDFLFPDLAD